MSTTTLIAAGDLRLAVVGCLAEQLRGAFAGPGAVRLDLSAVIAPDLSVLQLIQSARTTATMANRDFALAAPGDATLRRLLDRAGFLSGASDDDRRFWLHEEATQWVA
ncbi:MAG: hypothetical protein DI544_13590 [Sphingomonas taxi]|uniref:STAS domain-containing protein n=1 Tax=Sphingomonas taxi TaxID=1549858 RepID=A0A2W5QLL4_9SPHN|nr:MAG: hypothetical protein DI544_13590 [Sphingomonas taxi]